jgi:hypothetical protein
MANETRIRTFWEAKSRGDGSRLVREWITAEGYVLRFEVLAESHRYIPRNMRMMVDDAGVRS